MLYDLGQPVYNMCGYKAKTHPHTSSPLKSARGDILGLWPQITSD